MKNENGYLVIDIGTGNVRVAVTDVHAGVLALDRADVQYHKDDRYPDALYFEPNVLWQQIVQLTKAVLQQQPAVRIKAVTASSQREGIVLMSKDGGSLIGLSNHDHRGREWESIVKAPHDVYRLTGRYPTSLFSAMKLVGIRERQPEIFEKTSFILSISDWAQYRLCGVAGYEHSQASETLLYDIEKGDWSNELCAAFGLDKELLPPLHQSGKILGSVSLDVAKETGLPGDAVVIVGGADTQLAIKSTQPAVDDIVLVSGTTTPVVKISREFMVDDEERTWTNRDIEEDCFIIEANAGVTGLNLQRLKEIFYPTDSYEQMEKELSALTASICTASLGSMLAQEKASATTGGFVFDVPVSHNLSRACFVQSALWDIACAIKENLDCLAEVVGYDKDYLWACGGGFQSSLLRHYIAGLTGKKLLLRNGYRQASVVGGALVCAEAMDEKTDGEKSDVQTVLPSKNGRFDEEYKRWKAVRRSFQQQVKDPAL